MTTAISKSTTPAAVKASGSPAKKKQRNNAAKKSSVATASPQPVFPANRDNVSMEQSNPVFMAAAAAAAANDLAMVFPFSGMNTSSTEQQSSAFSAKPKEVSAGPPRHENTTLLPIASSQMATGSPAPPPPTAGPIAWHLLLSYYYQQQLLLPPLVKDDVFLAAPSVINDNESVITTNSSNDDGSSSSNSSATAAPNSTVGWAPTPCLSPVTSPSDFLCNHEPLFDGIEDLQQQQQQQQQHKYTHNSNYFDDNDDTQITSNITNDDHPASETSDSPATPPPLFDWYDFKDDNDNAAHMPTPSPTASDHESCSLFGDVDEPLDFDDEISSICSDEDITRRRELSFDDDEEEDDEDEDEDDEEDDYALPSSGTSLKRKRSMLSSDEEDDDEGDQGIMEHVEEDQEESTKDNIPVLQRLHRLRLSPPVVTKPTTTTATRKTPVNQQRKQKPKPAAKRRTKRHSGRRGARPKAIPAAAVYDDLEDEQDGVHRTIFERLTHAGIDWCRYCGTTEGVNWRPGPWGKRTLCNKHGCDYKGYGIASRLPRLDLSAFSNEKLEDRRRPVVQQFCVVCQKSESTNDNKLIPCEGGCSRAYHQQCRIPAITTAAYQDQQWCCSTVCRENRKRNKVGPYEM